VETSVSTLPASMSVSHAQSAAPAGSPYQASTQTSQQVSKQAQTAIQIRTLARHDAQSLHALICACPPLDVNSLYAYALLALHHTSTCFVAERDGQLCGAVTGYVPPGQPDTYFLWQIAISPSQQGTGLGSALLNHVAHYCLQPNNLHFLETTISPGNEASQRLFRRFAQREGVDCQQLPLLSSEELQPLQYLESGQLQVEHEAEDLYRIGPWSR
jgi:L-2,4-diaminobutyric acid acetyltransferase